MAASMDHTCEAGMHTHYHCTCIERLTKSRNITDHSVLGIESKDSFNSNLNSSICSSNSLTDGVDSIDSIICDDIDAALLKGEELSAKCWDSYRIALEHDWNKMSDEKKGMAVRRNGFKRSLIMVICVLHPPLEIVKLLVKYGKADAVTETCKCGFTALHYACWGNASLEVIQYLLEVGKKEALMTKSEKGGSTALHTLCLRYKSEELPGVIRLFIEVGKHDVITALDSYGDIPAHCLLTRQGRRPIEAIILFLETICEFEEKTGGSILYPRSSTCNDDNTSFDGNESKDYSKSRICISSSSTDGDNTLDSTSSDDIEEAVPKGEEINNENEGKTRDLGETGGIIPPQISTYNNSGVPFTSIVKNNEVQLKKSFNNTLRQVVNLKKDYQNQILATKFMKKFLTEKFIQPLPLAILIMDLYIQLVIVFVLSFCINRDVQIFDNIHVLIVCVGLLIFEELIQVLTTSIGSYIGDISNWIDVLQIVLILLTISINPDGSILSLSLSDRLILGAVTLCAWLELLFELHNFNYHLAIFVVATVKVMKRLGNFIFTTVFFLIAFAHVYYIAGPNKIDCDEGPMDDEDPEKTGRWACTLQDSYRHTFDHFMDFEIPKGVPNVINYAYGFVMLILLMNIVIAVISTSFDEVMRESELTFWSERFVIFLEVENKASLLFTKRVLNRSLQKHPNNNGDKRFDFNFGVENKCLRELKADEKLFFNWWYGKDTKDTIPLKQRLSFFFSRSVWKDILLPGIVFEKILLGRNKFNRKQQGAKKIFFFICSLVLFVVSNFLLLILLLSGWMSFGLLWPRELKVHLFYVKEIDKKKDKLSEVIRDETNKLSEEIRQLKHSLELKLEIGQDKV